MRYRFDDQRNAIFNGFINTPAPVTDLTFAPPPNTAPMITSFSGPFDPRPVTSAVAVNGSFSDLDAGQHHTGVITAVDGQVNGGGGIDRFRIKIWDRTTAMVVYDNVGGASQYQLNIDSRATPWSVARDGSNSRSAPARR